MIGFAQTGRQSRKRLASSPSWSTTLFDLIMLLLAFMVMDWAMRRRDAVDWERFRQGFAGPSLAHWLEPGGRPADADESGRQATEAGLDLAYLYALLGGRHAGAEIALAQGSRNLEIALPPSWFGERAQIMPEGVAGLRRLAGALSRASNPVAAVAPASADGSGQGLALATGIARILADGGYMGPVSRMAERGGVNHVRLVVRPRAAVPGGAP